MCIRDGGGEGGWEGVLLFKFSIFHSIENTVACNPNSYNSNNHVIRTNFSALWEFELHEFYCTCKKIFLWKYLPGGGGGGGGVEPPKPPSGSARYSSFSIKWAPPHPPKTLIFKWAPPRMSASPRMPTFKWAPRALFREIRYCNLFCSGLKGRRSIYCNPIRIYEL